MKIGNTIHPKRGAHAHKGERHVKVGDTTYTFRATTDKHGATHFVADVSDADHAATLLSIDAYYAYDHALQPKPTLSRGSKGDETPPPAPPAPPVTDDTPTTAKARKLLEGSANTIGQEIGKLDVAEAFAVVLAAVAIEQAAEKPRNNVVTLLNATLDGLKASGHGG